MKTAAASVAVWAVLLALAYAAGVRVVPRAVEYRIDIVGCAPAPAATRSRIL